MSIHAGSDNGSLTLSTTEANQDIVTIATGQAGTIHIIDLETNEEHKIGVWDDRRKFGRIGRAAMRLNNGPEQSFEMPFVNKSLEGLSKTFVQWQPRVTVSE